MREELGERKSDGQEQQQKALSSGGKVMMSHLEAAMGVWHFERIYFDRLKVGRVTYMVTQSFIVVHIL